MYYPPTPTSGSKGGMGSPRNRARENSTNFTEHEGTRRWLNQRRLSLVLEAAVSGKDHDDFGLISSTSTDESSCDASTSDEDSMYSSFDYSSHTSESEFFSSTSENKRKIIKNRHVIMNETQGNKLDTAFRVQHPISNRTHIIDAINSAVRSPPTPPQNQRMYNKEHKNDKDMETKKQSDTKPNRFHNGYTRKEPKTLSNFRYNRGSIEEPKTYTNSQHWQQKQMKYIHPNVLSASGDVHIAVAKEGTLKRRSKLRWLPYWFRLEVGKNALFYYSLDPKRATVPGVYQLSEAVAINRVENRIVISLKNSKTIVLKSSSEDEAQGWVSVIGIRIRQIQRQQHYKSTSKHTNKFHNLNIEESFWKRFKSFRKGMSKIRSMVSEDNIGLAISRAARAALGASEEAEADAMDAVDFAESVKSKPGSERSKPNNNIRNLTISLPLSPRNSRDHQKYKCSHGCGFSGDFDLVTSHELFCRAKYRFDKYFCERGCGFRGSYKAVEFHETTCLYIKRMRDSFSCCHGCGYVASYVEVQQHEKTCLLDDSLTMV